MRVAFDGVAATFEVPDSPGFLSALRASAIDWPFCQVSSEGEPAARITAAGDACLIHFPGEEPLRASDVGAACSLMVSLAEALVTENPDRLCLHAGAVRFAGRLVVFPNRSHAGKSTLIARLAAAGYTVFGDDIVPIDEAGNGVALGVAPRLRLPLPAASSTRFREFVDAHVGASDGRYHYLALPPAILARRGEIARPGAVVLLDRHPEGDAKLYDAPRSLALKLLVQQNVSRSDDARPLLAQMNAFVQGLPCFVLSYADLEDATALLGKAFASWPPRVQTSPLDDVHAVIERMLAMEPIPHAGGTQCNYAPGMRLARRPDAALHLVDGEAFLAGGDNAAAIQHLNAIGAGIWNLLAEPIEETEAAEVLAMAFPDVDPDIIAGDVNALFTDLHRSGFAVEVDR